MVNGGLPVRLRDLILPDDVEIAIPWYTDAEVLYFSEGPNVAPFDYNRIEKMYKWLSQRGQVYIIEVFDGGWVPVGDVTLCEELIPIVVGDNRYRRRGVGSRVIELLIEKAKGFGWSKLTAHKIFAYNTPSIKLFENHGFIKTSSETDEDGHEFFRYERKLN
ncbi:hypothetical protein MM817_03208 [Acidibacillus sp. S0AB]|uniref:N-acetyltransferase domain-containing protein n=1 Tax=Sulfoacidibacillus ferrooxidans TaxID=2005001 RepID=A0A9X1VAW8_9BACL|nr:hypothetical protein [Sulfoacidibacillus ferrooxidans]